MGILLVVDHKSTNVEFVFKALEYTPVYHVDDSPSSEEFSFAKHIQDHDGPALIKQPAQRQDNLLDAR
jgi:hypothetical protein